MGSSRAVWFGIFIGSAIGGLVPALWGAGALSYSSVLFSGIGAIAGLWIGLKVGN
jgi:predicted MFS family arabinose efflux permease